MANFSIKEIIEDMYNEHKIIDSEKYNKLFENIYSRGLITIFSEPDMYEAILIDILINMLKTYNSILLLLMINILNQHIQILHLYYNKENLIAETLQDYMIYI